MELINDSTCCLEVLPQTWSNLIQFPWLTWHVTDIGSYKDSAQTLLFSLLALHYSSGPPAVLSCSWLSQTLPFLTAVMCEPAEEPPRDGTMPGVPVCMWTWVFVDSTKCIGAYVFGWKNSFIHGEQISQVPPKTYCWTLYFVQRLYWVSWINLQYLIVPFVL